jgi:hypothetical protein
MKVLILIIGLIGSVASQCGGACQVCFCFAFLNSNPIPFRVYKSYEILCFFMIKIGYW